MLRDFISNFSVVFFTHKNNLKIFVFHIWIKRAKIPLINRKENLIWKKGLRAYGIEYPYTV